MYADTSDCLIGCINHLYVLIWFCLHFLLNSAALSMLPWPKPAVWPAVPADASSEVLAKEKVSLYFIVAWLLPAGFMLNKNPLSFS